MEPKFQTSFIPKKPTIPVMGGLSSQVRVHRTFSIFMFLAVIIFVISLAGVGGAYFWKTYLLKVQVAYKTELANKEKQFDPALVGQLKQANFQIETAKKLLGNHIALSQIFGVIQELTVSYVRFVSLDFSGPTSDSTSKDMSVKMEGYGIDLPAVAFQSDVLGKLEDYGLANVVSNAMVSDPSLDATGAVSFSLSATVNPSMMSYKESLKGR